MKNAHILIQTFVITVIGHTKIKVVEKSFFGKESAVFSVRNVFFLLALVQIASEKRAHVMKCNIGRGSVLCFLPRRSDIYHKTNNISFHETVKVAYNVLIDRLNLKQQCKFR